MKVKKQQPKRKDSNNPLVYFLDSHIEPSASLARVEASFNYAMTTISRSHQLLFEVYESALKKYSSACVYVVPSPNKGLDMIPGDLAYLHRLNGDEQAKIGYLGHGHNHIPCYLHSRNIMKDEEVGKPYEFKLILIPYLMFN